MFSVEIHSIQEDTGLSGPHSASVWKKQRALRNHKAIGNQFPILLKPLPYWLDVVTGFDLTRDGIEMFL